MEKQGRDGKHDHNLKLNPAAFDKSKIKEQQLHEGNNSSAQTISRSRYNVSSHDVSIAKDAKGLKRCHSSDELEKPAKRRLYTSCEKNIPSCLSEKKLYKSSAINTCPLEKKSQSSGRTRNLAQHRMSNLRKSLNEKLEESLNLVNQKQQMHKSVLEDNLHSKSSMTKFKNKTNTEAKISFKSASKYYLQKNSSSLNYLSSTVKSEEHSYHLSSKSATITKDKYSECSDSSTRIHDVVPPNKVKCIQDGSTVNNNIPGKNHTSFSFISNYADLIQSPKASKTSEHLQEKSSSTISTSVISKNNINRNNNNDDDDISSVVTGNSFWPRSFNNHSRKPRIEESSTGNELASKWKRKPEKEDTFTPNSSRNALSESVRYLQEINFTPPSHEDRCEDMDTSMEWLPINEEQVVANIKEMRKEINYNDNMSVHNFSPRKDNYQSSMNGIYIVIDTNIFLSHLTFVSGLKDMAIEGLGPIVVVVPWMVIQELDYMKDGRTDSSSLKNGARKAINFIHECLSNKHPKFRGQTVMEAAQFNLSSNNPDDGILFCCLQLAEQQKTVALLSNDKNLRNKILVSGLFAYSQSEIIKCLKDFHRKNSNSTSPNDAVHNITKIKILLSNFFTFIIESEMKKAYGDLWIKMALMSPPFTVEEALTCLDRYWMSVFSFNLQKQCKQCVDEFAVFVKSLRYGDELSTTHFNKYIEHCLKLCIYFKNGYSTYRDQINQVIQGIQLCAQ